MEFYAPEQPFPFEPLCEDQFQLISDGVVYKLQPIADLTRTEDEASIIRVSDNDTIARVACS